MQECFEKLKIERKKRGLTCEDMGRILSISPCYYSQIENKKRRLLYSLAIKIAKVFDLKPDDIFY